MLPYALLALRACRATNARQCSAANVFGAQQAGFATSLHHVSLSSASGALLAPAGVFLVRNNARTSKWIRGWRRKFKKCDGDDGVSSLQPCAGHYRGSTGAAVQTLAATERHALSVGHMHRGPSFNCVLMWQCFAHFPQACVHKMVRTPFMDRLPSNPRVWRLWLGIGLGSAPQCLGRHVGMLPARRGLRPLGGGRRPPARGLLLPAARGGSGGAARMRGAAAAAPQAARAHIHMHACTAQTCGKQV